MCCNASILPAVTQTTTGYTQGNSDVILMPAGFRCRLVGKTLINVFHSDSAEIRFVGELLVIVQTFS